MKPDKNWKTHIVKVFKLFPLKRSNLFYLLILIIFLSIFELFGISLLIPLVDSLMSGKSNLNTFDKIPYVSDFKIFKGDTVSIAILMIVIFSFKTLLTLLFEAIVFFISFKSRAILRAKMLNIYLNKNFIEFIKFNSSELINSIQSYTGQHRGTILNSLKLINEFLFLFFILLFVTFFYGEKAILVMILLSLFIFLFDRFTKIYFYKIGLEVNKINTKVIKILSESFFGIKEVKIYKIDEYYFNSLKEISLHQSKIETIYEILSKLPKIFFEYIVIVFFIFIGIYIQKNNVAVETILPDITLIFFLILRTIPISANISNYIKTIRHNMNGINQLFDQYYSYLDKENNFKKDEKLVKKGFQSLELKNIKFQYPENKQHIFENVNFKINKGDFVGIIGQSGSGKTTLVDLVLGLLKPTSGEIFYNNISISKNDYTSSSFAAYLPQNNFIIDDTIEKNIALDYYKNGLNHQKLQSVIEKSNLAQFVEALPNKSKTVLGEYGRFISGGQKQRVAIARALYFDRELLILDESTNALDKDLERSIINELIKLKDDLGIIIITHNTENLNYCNKVYTIENKKLIESKNIL